MPARFPYLPVASGRGDAALMPMLPLGLRYFFEEFDVSFHRSRRRFELEPARK